MHKFLSRFYPTDLLMVASLALQAVWVLFGDSAPVFGFARSFGDLFFAMWVWVQLTDGRRYQRVQRYPRRIRRIQRVRR